MIIFQKEYELGAMHRSAAARHPTSEIKKVQTITQYTPRSMLTNRAQYAFTTVLLYHTAIYSTKFSILAFYAKLFPPTSRGLRIGCFLAIAYTLACYLVAIFLTIFWCGPRISRSFETGEGACTVWSVTLFKVNFAMNISSDILSMCSFLAFGISLC
jgi:hypothetical protein